LSCSQLATANELPTLLSLLKKYWSELKNWFQSLRGLKSDNLELTADKGADHALAHLPFSEGPIVQASGVESDADQVEAAEALPYLEGVHDAELDKWYQDSDCNKAWRVKEKKIVKTQLNDGLMKGDLIVSPETLDSKVEHDGKISTLVNGVKDCSVEIYWTAVISVLTTVTANVAYHLVVYHFPEHIQQMKDFFNIGWSNA
jgi:hypothetical protein